MTDRRSYSGPAFFSHGFRPFFLGAGVFSLFSLAVWIGYFVHGWSAFDGRDMLSWHGHEMIFGYLGAVITGFILTAIPNWTGRLPVTGLPLATLFGLWIAGRAAMLLLPDISSSRAVIDAGFLIVVSLIVWREIFSGKNWRNMPVASLITLLAIANIIFHIENLAGSGSDYGQRLALSIAVLMITLIGGRIVPSFTLNWMKKQGYATLPPAFGLWDKFVILATILAMILWLGWPNMDWTGWALLIAGLAHTIRLARWRGWQTFSEPLVLVLHVGYAWLALSLLLMGGAISFPEMIGVSAARHALTAGAIGMMTVAVMTRATLGHTGRALTAGPGTVLIYLSLALAAIMRVSASLLPLDYTLSLAISGSLWSTAYLLFAIIYGPMLIKSRAA